MNSLNHSLFLRKDALISILSIIVTACLMIWLTGGLYPRTWQLLFLVSTQFFYLWEQSHRQLLLSIVLLTVQSLLLAGAWGMLLRLAFQEGFRMFDTWRAEVTPIPVRPSSAPQKDEALSDARLPVPAQANWHLSTPAHANPGLETLSTSTNPLAHSVPPRQEYQGSSPDILHPAPPAREQPYEELENPFEERSPAPQTQKPRGVQRLPQEKKQAGSVSAVPLQQIDLSTPYASQATLVPILPPTRTDEERPLMSASQTTSGERIEKVENVFSVEQRNEALEKDNPFLEPEGEQARFSSVLRELGFFRMNQASETEQHALLGDERVSSPPVSSDIQKVDNSSSPFDVQSDVLALFPSSDTPEPPRPRPTKKQSECSPGEAITPEPNQKYLLGNPFEGALPDIFEQDEELKQSVMEQVSQEPEQLPVRKRVQGQAGTKRRTTRRQPGDYSG